ncbi:Uncharacterised protein [Yersinia aldovae]|uniref:hypothetical protein n=1 Tax=Yersinia aldovae TaxID=29483 RepID=UPI0005E05B38|nr:hypothetical protein [Yersinia aldovae]CNI21219.1 Uncharacterised protein [Yersinia aldovae]
MKRLLLLSLVVLYGCSTTPVIVKSYDKPDKGYVVYTPKSGFQRFDGLYLQGFKSSSYKYLNNCVATGPLKPNKILQASLSYDENDGVVYLRYPGGPSMASCDINQENINIDVENYINKTMTVMEESNSREADALENKKSQRKSNPGKAATDDSIQLFVKYCTLLKDATNNKSYLNDLRSMKHEYIGVNMNKFIYNHALYYVNNSGYYSYCESALPKLKAKIYALNIDPTK